MPKGWGEGLSAKRMGRELCSKGVGRGLMCQSDKERVNVPRG